MSREFKIELINAYHKLLEVTLKPATKNAEVQAQVQEEFKEFVNSRLNQLMGNDSEKEDELTSDEKVFLKSFISRAKNKPEGPSKPLPTNLNKNAGTTEVGKENPRKDPNPPAYVPRNLQPALGNKQTHKESKQAINKGVLDQLDEMDKKFENEW